MNNKEDFTPVFVAKVVSDILTDCLGMIQVALDEDIARTAALKAEIQKAEGDDLLFTDGDRSMDRRKEVAKGGQDYLANKHLPEKDVLPPCTSIAYRDGWNAMKVFWNALTNSEQAT